jgi:DNA-directed RNA polymerase beta' subunit
LGIEAARQSIHMELLDVMEFSGVSINYHHTSLLADRMTCNKDMVSIFRSGLLSDNVGPIAKATFEMHTEVFLDAARHGEFDPMTGVSAAIMCGQQGGYGTSSFQIIMDTKAMEGVESVERGVKTISVDTALVQRAATTAGQDECTRQALEIDNHVHTIRAAPAAEVVCVDDEYDAGF